MVLIVEKRQINTDIDRNPVQCWKFFETRSVLNVHFDLGILKW